jgi:Tfp pilus assembly protein PilF
LIYYVNTGQAPEAKKLIQIAKENNPKSQLVYFAEAKMYENLQDIEKAAESYETCLKLDSSSFNYNFNEGALFYNKAVDILKNAASITDDKKYNEALTVAKDYLTRALPKMEKAHSIKPDNRTSVEVLKEIYYRLGMNDKSKFMKDLLEKMPKS